ncbi:hypothetical protein B0J13DRAFT_580779 [Dactylonectria estremocensis]|uniref:Fe2OG dioxygenase domain-containing protein n=1 Tax=Dactylonectria estremocensis TaxID=1079267 RepID=A0A9P9FE97_9HYPO|nr:hypothetical protein B0J13DRAFT_580779 [Dactylonectria estremocensis]
MTEVIASSPVPQLKLKPILKGEVKATRSTTRSIFNPEKHLAYSKDPKVLSLADVALPEDAGISHVACSEPFPLFSEEAIRVMRDEIFTTDVWENCLYSTEFAACQLRGHCPNYAPFMTQAWKNPKTLSIISKVAGVDLIPNIEYEIGNINIAVHDPKKDSSKVGKDDANVSVTKWHYDSYPFVCVVMMSDATEMLGGETALMSGTGEILKVRGPQMGSAVVLQGRYVQHQALAALGGKERITMITSFRPRDALIKDDSVLTSIRPISEHSELYYQWTKYRVEVVQERLKALLCEMEENHRVKKRTDVQRVKAFLEQQQSYLAITNNEIVENQGRVRGWGET